MNASITGMKWKPIEDLPADSKRFQLDELRPLDALWNEKREELEKLDGMRAFRDRLSRSWAIETGVIERVYDLDRGTTELLIEEGIKASLIDRSSTDKDPELVARIIGDQRETIDALFDFIKRERPLSVGYIKELHATLTRSQTVVEGLDQFGSKVTTPLRHGDWKQMANNPTRPDGILHEYAPPEHVQSEMERLVAIQDEHDRLQIEPEVSAAWLHHRFTQIHPFQDGNGRVARALASLIFLRAGWFPLTIDRDRKLEYIDSLEAADLGDLRYLSHLFGTLERNELVRALGIGDQAVREHEGLEQVIKAAQHDLLTGAAPRESAELMKVRATAAKLQTIGVKRLREVNTLMNREISDYRPEFSTRIDSAGPQEGRAREYIPEIVEVAREFHYFANPRTYAAWIRMAIADREANTLNHLVIDFHGIGREFRGLIAVVAFHVQYQFTTDDKGKQRRRQTSSQSITDELFQVNYLEEPEAACERFMDWLNGVITIGLEQWRSSLPAGRGTD